MIFSKIGASPRSQPHQSGAQPGGSQPGNRPSIQVQGIQPVKYLPQNSSNQQFHNGSISIPTSQIQVRLHL